MKSRNYSKFKQVLIAVLILNVLLVATHEGEFWPFSIFPMFSKAGKPWTRAMVQKVENPEDNQIWKTAPLAEVSDNAVALEDFGIDPIDYANFISKTGKWTDSRVKALGKLFDLQSTGENNWLVTKVDGYLTEQDSVAIKATPMILFTQDTTIKNPNLFK